MKISIIINIDNVNNNNYIYKSKNDDVEEYIEYKDKNKIKKEFDFVEEVNTPILIKKL